MSARGNSDESRLAIGDVTDSRVVDDTRSRSLIVRRAYNVQYIFPGMTTYHENDETTGERASRLKREGKWTSFTAYREALEEQGDDQKTSYSKASMDPRFMPSDAELEDPTDTAGEPGPADEDEIDEEFVDLAIWAGRPKTSTKEDIRWTAASLHADVTIVDAPSPGAWSWREWVLSSPSARSAFFSHVLSKMKDDTD